MMKSSEGKTHSKSIAIGTDVKIISGSFKDFKGTVIEVDTEKSMLDVSVSVFNRETTVEVNFDNVEIIK